MARHTETIQLRFCGFILTSLVAQQSCLGYENVKHSPVKIACVNENTMIEIEFQSH